MAIKTSGLHHVTAIGGDPQRNVDFHLRTLGLRMVKTTVNFDDPGTYHLYNGDEAGKPGTLLFERWDGKGIPGDCAREEVPASVRVVQVARDIDLWLGIAGIETAVEVIGRRAGHAYDPAVAAAFTTDACGARRRRHPRCLAGDTGRGTGPARSRRPRPPDRYPARVRRLRRPQVALAARPFDRCGRVGIANGIWDKAGPLTLDEWEKVRLHPYLTERILSRSPALAPLARLAACHHERADGSGYHRAARSAELSTSEQLLGAADAYQAMTEAVRHGTPATPVSTRALTHHLLGER